MFGLIGISIRRKTMDPVTLAIVTAVTAGVVSGAGDAGKQVVADVYGVGKQAIVDAYNKMKELIHRKFGNKSKLAQAIEYLETEPGLALNQQMVQHRVEETKA